MLFFFFKQKTAYEMRISDWSSDVCSSDLGRYNKVISVNEPSALHDAGHSLGLWLFSDTTPWFEFVLHAVLLGMPLALVLVLATWIHRLFRQLARNHRERVAISASAASSRGIRTGVFHYILRHTRRSQFFLLATVRSEEHTSELQSLMRHSYAVFCF